MLQFLHLSYYNKHFITDTVATVMATYAHVLPQMQKDAAIKLNELLKKKVEISPELQSQKPFVDTPLT